MHPITLGILSRSGKEHEFRLPVHPAHFPRIDADLRERIHVEHGYGERFGVSDEELGASVAGVRSREQLIADCDVILLAKPLPEDLAALRPGQALWGWPDDGSFTLHVFHMNNEPAGYGSVVQGAALAGLTGDYGRRLRAAVIGSGAVTGLTAHGVHDVHVLTQRGVSAVSSPIHSAKIVQFDHEGMGSGWAKPTSFDQPALPSATTSPTTRRPQPVLPVELGDLEISEALTARTSMGSSAPAGRAALAGASSLVAAGGTTWRVRGCRFSVPGRRPVCDTGQARRLGSEAARDPGTHTAGR